MSVRGTVSVRIRVRVSVRVSVRVKGIVLLLNLPKNEGSALGSGLELRSGIRE